MGAVNLVSWSLDACGLGAEMRVCVSGTPAPSQSLCLLLHCTLFTEHLFAFWPLIHMLFSKCNFPPPPAHSLHLEADNKPGIRANKLQRVTEPENRAASLPRAGKVWCILKRPINSPFCFKYTGNGACDFPWTLPLLRVAGCTVPHPGLAYIFPAMV